MAAAAAGVLAYRNGDYANGGLVFHPDNRLHTLLEQLQLLMQQVKEHMMNLKTMRHTNSMRHMLNVDTEN